MLLELFLICCIVVNIVDISGFTVSMKGWICKVLNRPQQEYSIKPFDCSYCMTHHLGLIWLLIKGFSLEYYCFLLLLCCFTPVIKDIMILMKDVMSMLIDKIYFLLNNNQN